MENLDLNIIISYIISPPFQRTFLVLKFLFIAISLYFLVSIIYYLSKTHYIQWLYGEDAVEFFVKKVYGVRSIDKTWDKISERLKSGLESDYKLAVIEADGILDKVLKGTGYKGKDLGERLKQMSPAHFSDLNSALRVHKIRNDIVRDPDYQLSVDEAKKVLAVYRKILEDLEVF